jgi:hypothetical protein
VRLDPDKFQEDRDPLVGPYGHRFEDALHTTERTNRDEDKFLPTRRDGPQYEGFDSPGVPAVRPFDTLLNSGDTYIMHLDFQGGAFDTCAGSAAVGGAVRAPAIPIPIGGWNNWTVKGSYTKPGGATPSGQGGGGAPATETPARPFIGHWGGPSSPAEGSSTPAPPELSLTTPSPWSNPEAP